MIFFKSTLQDGSVEYFAFDENSKEEIAQFVQPEWVPIEEIPAPEPFIDPYAAVHAAKMTGMAILGVMCSATKNDQAGLSAVALGVTLARMAAQTFPDTKFEFENGSSLVITDANFDSIYAAWTPFRQSFFAP